MRRQLTMAMSDYDHVRDLVIGTVPVEGVDLTTLHLPVEEIFYRFLHHREWHVTELSLAKYVSLRASGDKSISAIPVFPSRVCRHSSFLLPDDPQWLLIQRVGDVGATVRPMPPRRARWRRSRRLGGYR